MTDQRGFTLIELLVVVAVIGVIVAIALPNYTAYKVRGYNVMAESALKNMMLATETYNERNGQYPNCSFPVSFGGASICNVIMPDFNPNPEVRILFNYGNDVNLGSACHVKGNLIYRAKNSKGIIEIAPFDCSAQTTSSLALMRTSNTVYYGSP